MAAIVYDDVYEPLIIMSMPPAHPDPGIPAVFVSQRSGVMLKRLITEGESVVEITAVSNLCCVCCCVSQHCILCVRLKLSNWEVRRGSEGLESERRAARKKDWVGQGEMLGRTI